MFSIQLYAGTIFIVVLYSVILPLVRALLSPLRRVPGPFLARLTRLFELNAVLKHEFAAYNISLHEKYGPVVRLAPNRYSINDPSATKVLLGHHNALKKSNYYIPFGDPKNPNVFSVLDIAAHSKIRRPIAHLYSTTNLLSYEPFVDASNRTLLTKLREYSRTGTSLNLRALMQYYAFDLIGEITLGSSFGFMKANHDKDGTIRILDDAIKHGGIIGLVPEIHMLLCALANALHIKPAFSKVVAFVERHVDDRITGRTKSQSDRQDFLDKLLPLERSGKTSRAETLSACGANIAAGSDTSGISLTAAIGYLALYPNVLAKLRKELDDAVSSGIVSDTISFQEAQKLPYLNAVIQETLRIHPAVGAPMTRIIGPAGAHFSGYFFPPGTEVGVNAWVVHRDESIFGAETDAFRPERWLVEDAEMRSAMERNFLAFGAGPRTCLGKNISLLEMFKVIPAIAREFDFEIVGKGEKGEGGYRWKTIWFAKQEVECIVKERKL